MQRTALLLTAGLLWGCSADTSEALDTASASQTCDGPDAKRLHWVIDSLYFARVTDGVSDGFDLDGLTTEAGASDGCGRTDWTAPDGTEGIDNAFGEVIPALENTEFVAAEALINDTIKTGELMLLVSMDHVDDPMNDDCVDVSLGRAIGEPMLGTDDSFLPGQTLTRDAEFSGATIENLAVADGTVSGRPITTTIPVQVLNAALEFEILEGAVRVDQHEDGTASGAFAGGIDIATVIAVANSEGIAQELKDLLSSVLYIVADLAPNADGECEQLSITFEYTATPVYLFDDE
jgi:hypothetical protein